MNITNLEFTQATLEIFCGLICLLINAIISINGHNTKSMKLIKQLFFMTSVIFFAESLAYIYRGNIDSLSIFITKAGNFVVFVLNFLLTSLFIRYTYSVMEEKEIVLKPIYRQIIDICTLSAIVIVLVSQFTNWMYYFDEMNYYHRNTGWYVYTLLSLALPVVTLILVTKNRKSLSKTTFVSLVLYVLTPLIAIVIQSFIYGIAIVNFGIALSIFIMMFAYLNDWNKGRIIDPKEQERNKKAYQTMTLFAIMVMIMSVSILSCVFSIQRILNRNTESDNQNIAYIVSERIDNEFLKSKTVTQTMAKDYNVKQFLMKDSLNESEYDIVSYLKSIKNGFGYDMVYVIQDNSKVYYTNNGFAEFMNMENHANKWYIDFVASNVDIDLNVDTDEVNHWDLSVFTNARILDDNGNLIGVCGIGKDIHELQDILKKYEELYNIKIHLVDENGLIQICTDDKKILNEIVDISELEAKDSNSFSQKDKNDQHVLSKYMDELGWYLTIEFEDTSTQTLFGITAPSVLIYIVGIFFMGVVFAVFNIRERKAYKEMKEKKKASLTDDLTGLGNRRAYNLDVEMMVNLGLKNDLVLMLIDINGLKKVNDTMGHSAGDELIIGTANCLNNTLAEYGKVYRVGGDEFIAILYCSKNELKDILETMNHVVNNWKGKTVHELSISKGYVEREENKDMTYREMISLADKRMYEDKRTYYMEKEKHYKK